MALRGRIALTIVAALAALAPASAAAKPTDPVNPTDPAPFVLRDADTWVQNEALIADLAKRMPPATVAAVMRDVNRATRPLDGSGAVRGVPSVANGFRWNKGDDAVRTWYPQGITSSADATGDGKWGVNRITLVSWYAKGADAAKGVRISFVQTNKLRGARYRHVLLVEPRPGGTWGAVKVHAGGIAWYGSYLYVADTKVGLRVFDLRHILRATSAAPAKGYKYVLPQVSTYAQPAGGNLVFSFVSVDRGSSPPSLVTGEYRKGKPGARVVRWPLDAASDRLAGGEVHASGAFVLPQTNVQGALSAAGRLFISTSAGASRNGTLYTALPGQESHPHPWGVGAEDLLYSPLSTRIYSLTEHPGNRAVFAVPAAALP